MPRTRSNNLGEDRSGRCLESLFAGLTDGFCSVGGYEAWDRLRVSVVSTPRGSACSADACRCKAPTPLACPRRAFTPRVRPPTPMGLDRSHAFLSLTCPSPVPQEVEKQWVMMGTDTDYGGRVSPGQSTFPQVDGLWRPRTVPAFQAGNACSNPIRTAM